MIIEAYESCETHLQTLMHNIDGITITAQAAADQLLALEKEHPQFSAFEHLVCFHFENESQVDVMRILLNSGKFSDPSERTKALVCVLQEAYVNHRFVVDLLLEMGIDAKSEDANRALFEAASIGDIQLVTHLLDQGIDPNYFHPVYHSCTPLMGAIVGRQMGVPCNSFSLVHSILSSDHQFTDDALAHPSQMTDEVYQNILEYQQRYDRPGPHKKVIQLLLDHGAVPNHPKGDNASNAKRFAVGLNDSEILEWFAACRNEIPPRIGSSSFFAYDIFEKNGVNTLENTPKMIEKLHQGQRIIHCGDLTILESIPDDVEVWVIDGNITIHGDIGKNVKIFAYFMPLVRIRNENSYVLARCATRASNGKIQFESPYCMVGSSSMTDDRMILNGIEFMIPTVQQIPVLHGGIITIHGDITKTTQIIASDSVSVNKKTMIVPHPRQLNPDSGELEIDAFNMELIFHRITKKDSYFENTYLFQKYVDHLSDHRQTKTLNELLFYSVLSGTEKYLECLLACNGINLNPHDLNVFWPMFGMAEMRALLSLTVGKQENFTPIIVAQQAGHYSMVQRLIAAGAVDDVGQRLCVAVKTDHIEAVKVLLTHPDIVGILNEPGSDGLTPWILACQRGNGEIVNRLLEAGANISAHLATGETGLYFAAQRGHSQIVKVLLAHQDITSILNQQTLNGSTPLTAAMNCSAIIVADLLSVGVEIPPAPIGISTAINNLLAIGNAVDRAIQTMKTPEDFLRCLKQYPQPTALSRLLNRLMGYPIIVGVMTEKIKDVWNKDFQQRCLGFSAWIRESHTVVHAHAATLTDEQVWRTFKRYLWELFSGVAYVPRVMHHAQKEYGLVDDLKPIIYNFVVHPHPRQSNITEPVISTFALQYDAYRQLAHQKPLIIKHNTKAIEALKHTNLQAAKLGFTEVVEYWRKALIAKVPGAARDLSCALYNLGTTKMCLGDYRGAATLLEEACRSCDEPDKSKKYQNRLGECRLEQTSQAQIINRIERIACKP